MPAHRFRPRSLPLIASVLVAAVLAVAGCGSSSSHPSGTSSTPSTVPASAPPSLAKGAKWYVSLGDSYAAGYQPGRTRDDGRTTTNGFAYQLTSQLSKQGRLLQLANFGCAGATTTSLLQAIGCRADRLGPGGYAYPTATQAAAALGFIRAHRADLGLVTVVISGNDVTKCALATDVVGCLTSALNGVKKNLGILLPELRAAAGASVPIVGLTYPDVILGAYTSKNPKVHTLAGLSVTAFKSLVNPTLAAQYAAIRATFVDVTAGTGAYTPLTQTTTLAPYGTVPKAVAEVCQLTYYCQLMDIHPRTSGYAKIAGLIAQALPPAG